MESKDLSRQIEDLNTILEIARKLGATMELGALLELIINGALRVLDAERATLFLYDAEKQELYSVVAVGAESIRFSVQKGIAGECARTLRVISVADAYLDQRFHDAIDKETGWVTRNILACPLIGVHGQLVGVLQVLNKRDGMFDSGDTLMAETLAAQAGVALERSRLFAESLANQRLQHELQLARNIQRRILPGQAPRIDGFDLAAWNLPATETGGDCYDFICLDGAWGIMVGDATGHGLGPAMISTECRALVRGIMPLQTDPDATLVHVNKALTEDLSGDHFVTLFLGQLDPASSRMTWCSAGHGPMFWVRPKLNRVTLLESSTIPLGIDSAMVFQPPPALKFEENDFLAIITDGFFEWQAEHGEQFGTDRVCRLLLEQAAQPAQKLIALLYDSVVRFAQGTPQNDDLTAVVVKKSSRL